MGEAVVRHEPGKYSKATISSWNHRKFRISSSSKLTQLTYLIFVTRITSGACGEIHVKWRNFVIWTPWCFSLDIDAFLYGMEINLAKKFVAGE